MEYAFDADLMPWLSGLPDQSIADYHAVRAAEAQLRPDPYQPPAAVQIRDLTVPRPGGAPDVSVRVFAPSGQCAPLPGLVFFHGGGFVLGSVGQDHSLMCRLAAEVGALVVWVEYRLAPENPFPAGLDDCYTALTWATTTAELGVDQRRLAVGGDSAGGGLAAAVTLLARDRGGPALCFQYLGEPELDDRLDTPSMRAYDDTPLWNLPSAEFSWDSYLGPGMRGTSAVSRYAAPARAEDLSGLPPAFITVRQFDPLRDEGIIYAQRLAQANVPTELVCYPATFHGSALFQGAEVTRRMTTDLIAALRRAFRVASTAT